MEVRRIHRYAIGDDLGAAREFYVGPLGLEGAMEDPVLGLRSSTNRTAQVIVAHERRLTTNYRPSLDAMKERAS